MSDRPPTLFGALKPKLLFVMDSLVILGSAIAAVALPAALGWPAWTSVLSLLVVCVFLWAVMDLRTHSIAVFGVRRQVDAAVAREGTCDECGAVVGTGEKRRYAKQAVAFGVPLYTLDWGVNTYCGDCTESDAPVERRPGGDAAARRDEDSDLAQGRG